MVIDTTFFSKGFCLSGNMFCENRVMLLCFLRVLIYFLIDRSVFSDTSYRRQCPSRFLLRKSLEHLGDWQGKFDDVYPMHGDFPQKPEQVEKLIQGAREILEGKASASPVDMFGNKVMLYKFPYAGFLCEK